MLMSAAELEWAINAYLIVSAACIIPGGKLCDRAGARCVSMFRPGVVRDRVGRDRSGAGCHA
jgi:hypothetical protein